MRTKHERLEPLLFRVQLKRIRGRTLRTETLDRSCARNVKRSEDDFGKWTPFLLLRVQLDRIRGKALRNGPLENPSQCEGFGCRHCSSHNNPFCKIIQNSDLAVLAFSIKSLAASHKKGTHNVCEFLFQFNWSRKIPYMVFLLIDFHASNDLFYIENMGNPSFLL